MGKIPRVELRLVRKGGSILNVPPVTKGIEYYDALKKYMGSFDREVMIALCLDAHLRPINFHVVNIGGPESVRVDFRNLFRGILMTPATGFVLAHNHPSGDVMPSKDDLELTLEVVKASEILELDFRDHLVVSDKAYLPIRRVFGEIWTRHEIDW